MLCGLLKPHGGNLSIKTATSRCGTQSEKNITQDKVKVLKQCAHDPDVKPNQIDSRFNTWSAKSITTLYSITDKWTLKNLQGLQQAHGLEKQNFYRYLQLRYHMHNDDSVIKEMLRVTNSLQNRSIISSLYKKTPT